LPFLTKSHVRENVEAMKSTVAGPLKRYNTGGSSGEPLVFYTSVQRRSHDVAAKWRATRWWDVDIGDREIVVWGSPIELGAQDRLRTLRDAVMRSWLLPAFDMSEASLDAYVAGIRSRRPAMLFGYPSSLSLIAAHARRRGVAMDDLGIRVAFVTSERLYPEQRETIASVFGCRVANGYGGRDAGFIAHECPSGRMHISAEDILVELLDESGAAVPAGAAGEIVVTHMATADFPFVRYRTGDIGVLDTEPCPCGRGLPVLREIQGRSTDFVVAADGTVMHGLALIYAIRDLPGIEGFKIIQHDRSHTEVLLVRGADYDPGCAKRIALDFRRRLGDDVQIAVNVVESIPREASGKFRYVVSKVAAERGYASEQ
jgi:phenylacetate-CoA ligase